MATTATMTHLMNASMKEAQAAARPYPCGISFASASLLDQHTHCMCVCVCCVPEEQRQRHAATCMKKTARRICNTLLSVDVGMAKDHIDRVWSKSSGWKALKNASRDAEHA